MSLRESTSQNSITPRTLNLPSIEVTLEDGRTETTVLGESQGHGDGESSERQERDQRNRTLERLASLKSWKGVLLTIPHLTTGLVLLAVGGVAQSLFNSESIGDVAQSLYDYESEEDRPPASFLLSQPFTNHPFPPFIKNDGIIFPRLNDQQDHNLEKSCDSIGCSPYLSLMCITVGSMFVFCAISGVLVAMKLKEFVSCHLIWLSLSALCSVTFVAACIVGVNDSFVGREGLTESITIIIIAGAIETVFCIVDLCVLTHLNNKIGRPSGSARSVSDNGERSTRRHLPESSSVRDNEPGENMENDGTESRRNQNETSIRPTPRTVLRAGYIPRRRRSGQAMRDRNSLHPGYHHQMRNRVRRRPMLRAQNHYVLVPAAFGRPRAHSRVTRRQSAARRNRVEMPMFVLSNHDSYVQALNQSIEALETQPNRGSVPGDVLSSLSAVHAKRDERASAVSRRALEKTDSLETNLSSSSVDSSRILHTVSATTSDAETVQNMSQRQPHQVEAEEGQLSTVIGSGYSVSKKKTSGLNAGRQTHGSETDAECGNNASHSYSQSASLSSNKTRPASVLEDSVFHLPGWERSGSSQCMTDSEYCSQRKEEVKPPIPMRATRPRFYNAASEGDFTFIRNVGEIRGRMGNTSVSSDSGIADAPNTSASRFGRSHYRKVPPKVSPMVSMEMSELTLSNSHFHHSPVSPQTPSYENLHSHSKVDGRGNFAFANGYDRSPH